MTGTTKVNLNLRTAPRTGLVQAVIPADTDVTITGAPVGDWYPVTYRNLNGWVSGTYLEVSESARDEARKALLSYLHIAYKWGGQDRNGLDCSGLVGEWWEDIGFRPEGFDTTTDKLFDAYRTGALPGTKLTEGLFGALAFYGADTNAGHVVICWDDLAVIGANGGARSVDTVAEARARNACVRMDPIDYRDDLLGIWLPNYEWE